MRRGARRAAAGARPLRLLRRPGLRLRFALAAAADAFAAAAAAAAPAAALKFRGYLNARPLRHDVHAFTTGGGARCGGREAKPAGMRPGKPLGR